MSPPPVKTSVGSIGAKPPRTKVTFPQRVFLFWPYFSTTHKSTNHPLGVSYACEDFSWVNWCKTSSDKGYISSEGFSLLTIFLNLTQFYKSSIRCLRRLLPPLLAPLVPNLLGQRLLFLRGFFSFGHFSQQHTNLQIIH